jgi:hypothetical protein
MTPPASLCAASWRWMALQPTWVLWVHFIQQKEVEGKKNVYFTVVVYRTYFCSVL